MEPAQNDGTHGAITLIADLEQTPGRATCIPRKCSQRSPCRPILTGPDDMYLDEQSRRNGTYIYVQACLGVDRAGGWPPRAHDIGPASASPAILYLIVLVTGHRAPGQVAAAVVGLGGWGLALGGLGACGTGIIMYAVCTLLPSSDPAVPWNKEKLP